MIRKRLSTAFECQQVCGFRTSSPPRDERCNRCGFVSDCFDEFCSQCEHQDFSPVCPDCNADVVVDHPDTVRP